MGNETEEVSRWYAVRCLFQDESNKPWGPVDLRPGESAYEERITIWRAKSAESAIEFAEREAAEYASMVEGRYMGIAQAYQFDDDPVPGVEIFSLLRKSSLEPGEYIDHFFDTGAEYQRSTAVPTLGQD